VICSVSMNTEHDRVSSALIMARSAAVGGHLKSQLPWKRMTRVLVEQNIILLNYPERVPFPGTGEAKAKSQKGIAGLSLEDVQRLWHQIEHAKYPLSFRKLSTTEGLGERSRISSNDSILNPSRTHSAKITRDHWHSTTIYV